MAPHATTPRAAGSGASHFSLLAPAEDARTMFLNWISWGAVLAGVVVGLVTQILLSLLGVGIGAATLNSSGGDDSSAVTALIAAGLWYALSALLAAFVGGRIAGRLSGRPKESTAGLHGLTAWALTTLVIFYLLAATFGSLNGGVFNAVGGAVGALGRTATTAAPTPSSVSDPFDAVERQVREASGGNDPAALRDAAVTAVRAAFTGDQTRAQEARERAAQALTRAQNVPLEEARNRVGQLEQQYRQGVEQARRPAAQAADAAAVAVSRGALFGALALALGALAGYLGGRSGAGAPTMTAGGIPIVSVSPRRAV